jgi:hypothetical protein
MSQCAFIESFLKNCCFIFSTVVTISNIEFKKVYCVGNRRCYMLNRVHVFFILLLLYFSSLEPVHSATINRSVTIVDSGHLQIEIDWSLSSQIDSGLIVEEKVPEDWSLDHFECGDAEAKVRQENSSLSVAVGVGRGIAREGSFVYRLKAVGDDDSDRVHFDGCGYAIKKSEVVQFQVEGLDYFLIGSGDGVSGTDGLMLTEIVQSIKNDKRGLVLYLAVPDSTEETEALNSESGSSSLIEDAVLKVEYKENLMNNDHWQCIHTNLPSDRVASPDCVEISDWDKPGFYRVRIEDLKAW